MKLFGGRNAGSHRASVPKENKRRERFLDALSSFLNRGGWKKLRVPMIVIGCIVLAALLIIIIYSIWEKPPEPAAVGPTVIATPKPAVSELPVLPPEVTETPKPEETPEPEPTPAVPMRRENCYTFALLAYDQLGANTDTILVGRLDADNGTLDVVSIPRDTMVNVDWPVKKINTILASENNDADIFISHLSKLIGFTVDTYAVVDIRAVEKLVDCIGGVFYYVPRDMDYDDPTQDLHIHIAKGYQLLYGEDTVKVLRFRMGNEDSGYANGDLGRIATQQDLLTSVASQMLTLGNIPNIDRAIEIFQTYVKTNMAASNIAFFLHEFLLLDQENIRFHTLPGTGIGVRGGSYYQLNPDETLNLINTALNPFDMDIALENLDILQMQEDGSALSTSGEIVPKSDFYNFGSYVPPTPVVEEIQPAEESDE